jgi:uncharacterized repeat protein (TIGR03943 family)
MTWIRLRAIGLSAWCSFFVWLWVSGEMVRYLGPRTYWVIPFGAITLGIAAIAHVPLLARAGAEAGPRDLGALAIVVAPILLVVAVPSPQLGTLAASRRTTFGGGGGPVLAVPQGEPGRLSFADLHHGSRSPAYARLAGLVEGRELSLTGFVTDSDDKHISLTRFYVSCCAADAMPYTARILTGHTGGYPEGQWLRVRGHVIQDRAGYAVDAVSVEPVEEPRDPYL